MPVHPSPFTNRALLKEVPKATARASDDLIACTPAMVEALRLADAFAPADRPIVLYGETGTGKSRLAEFIHRLSGRTGGFHAMSVGTMAPSLVEDDLFGHDRGAFTDARTARVGLLGESGAGTLLLDDMQGAPLWLQRKLFDVMDRRVYRVLGSDRILAIACRFVISMNENPDTLVQQGLLIKDLRYRFRELWIRMAPLRERRAEIPILAARTLERYQKELPPDGPSRFSDAAMGVLRECEYPGNVRQLETIIERAYLLARNAGQDEIRTEDLAVELPATLHYRRHGDAAANRAVVQRMLEMTGGNVKAAAKRLGVSRTTVSTVRANIVIERPAP